MFHSETTLYTAVTDSLNLALISVMWKISPDVEQLAGGLNKCLERKGNREKTMQKECDYH